MQTEPVNLDPDPPAEADRQWIAAEAAEPSGDSYRVLPVDGEWTAWRIRRTTEGRHDVEHLVPLGRHDSPEGAWDACRTDRWLRARDREANTTEAARAKVPLDDRPPPER